MKTIGILCHSASIVEHWKAALSSLEKVHEIKVIESKRVPDSKLAISVDLWLYCLPAEDDQAEAPLQQLLKQPVSVLVMAQHPTDEEGAKWLSLGAKGYLNAYATLDRIQQAIQSVLNGYVWVGQSLMQKMLQKVTTKSKNNSQEKTNKLDLSAYGLTEREKETIEHILRGETNAKIAEAMYISDRTVKAHLHSIFKKMGVSDRLALALKVMNQASENEEKQYEA